MDSTKQNEFEWYQINLKMANSSIVRGIRVIAKSKRQATDQVKHILHTLQGGELVDKVIVEKVPDEILNKYNLNNQDDFDRFLQYESDDLMVN